MLALNEQAFQIHTAIMLADVYREAFYKKKKILLLKGLFEVKGKRSLTIAHFKNIKYCR